MSLPTPTMQIIRKQPLPRQMNSIAPPPPYSKYSPLPKVLLSWLLPFLIPFFYYCYSIDKGKNQQIQKNKMTLQPFNLKLTS